MRKYTISTLATALVLAVQASAEPQFDPKPWLEDLKQTREVLLTKYANLEWAVFDREANLPQLFADAQKRITTAQSETEARAAFDRLARKLGDGHVVFEWPSHHALQGDATAPPACGDYDSSIVSPAVTARMPGYQPISATHSDLFPVGTMQVGKYRAGIIRIGLFEPRGFPELCRSIIAALSIPPDKPCNDACIQRIDDVANKEFSEAFMTQLDAVKAAKIDMLLVDLTRNGGGSEWAEAAARMLTPVRLASERLQFVRGEHWAKYFTKMESDLRNAAKTASSADRAQLLKWADEAAMKKQIAVTPCNAAPLWHGKHPPCSWLGEGFWTTGFLASAKPDSLRGKRWMPSVFTPMEYPYREGIWRGPLIVLVDSGTGSASEEFAAELQDNRAALIVGETTAGAGCGHTDGGTPTTLKNSGAVLEVPDCARMRADGTNEVRGILPDLLVGWRKSDGPNLRAAALFPRLPEAIARAQHLAGTRKESAGNR